MRHYAFTLLMILFLNGCISKPSEKAEKEEIDPVIHLGIEASRMRTVKLSEIADTVIYMPLETGDALMNNNIKFRLSSRYIYQPPLVFDWQGQYVCTIGKRGQGPGEEVYLEKIMDKQNAYYSMADKLIAYDTQGEYAGVERNIREMHAFDLANAGSNLVLCLPDTLFFMTPDFNIVKERRVVDPWPEKTTIMSGNRVLRYFTENKDSVLFYNYFNDTIFRVKETTLEPRWIVELGNEKVPLEYLLGSEIARLGKGAKYFEAGQLASWEYLKETDNKIRGFAAYETDNMVFVLWLRLIEFNKLRKLPDPILQIAYYNKGTGVTVAVDEQGFVDDLSSLGTFYPVWGTHDNYMITSYWPYELRSQAEKIEQSGKEVDKNLKDLLSVVKDDDNPVLVMVRLKK